MSFDDSFMKNEVANLEPLTDEIKKQMLADAQRGHLVGQWRASLYQLRMMFDLTDAINQLDNTSKELIDAIDNLNKTSTRFAKILVYLTVLIALLTFVMVIPLIIQFMHWIRP